MSKKTGKKSRALEKIKYVSPEVLTPYNKNPRINDSAIPEVAQSIEAFDMLQPIVVDKKGVVIVGHTRLQAAIELELTEVPVVYADHLTAKQCRTYRLADNKTGEISVWDMDLLPDEFDGLEDEFTGFSKEAIDRMLGDDEMDDLDEIEDFSESVSFPIKCTTLAEKEKVQAMLNTKNESITFKDFYENFNNRNRS